MYTSHASEVLLLWPVLYIVGDSNRRDHTAQDTKQNVCCLASYTTRFPIHGLEQKYTFQKEFEGKKIRKSEMEPSQKYSAEFQPACPLGSNNSWYYHLLYWTFATYQAPLTSILHVIILQSMVLLFQFYRWR